MKFDQKIISIRHFAFLGLIITLSFGTISCNKLPGRADMDVGVIEGDTYHNDGIGWTIKIPKDCYTMTREELDQAMATGATTIKDATDLTIDKSRTKMLVGFQDNERNRLLSTVDDIGDVKFGSKAWDKQMDLVKNVLANTFDNFQLNYTTERFIEKIQGIDFNVDRIILLDDDENELLTIQLYATMINNWCFSTTISWDNPESHSKLMNAWEHSNFH